MHAVPQGSIATATPQLWDWTWPPAVPLSIAELVAARDMDARTAALAWLVLAGHGSILVAAGRPHAGKTTTLTALLDLLPAGVTRVALRSGVALPAPADGAAPRGTLLLAGELSAHLPVYLWGPDAVRAFRALREGFALASTLHADSAAEAISQLRDGLGVSAEDLARIDALLVMRDRRLVSLDRLRPTAAGPIAEPLVRADTGADAWIHDRSAQARLVAERHGWSAATAERAIARRADRITELVDRGIFGGDDVKAALAPLNDLDEGGPA